MAQDFYTVIDHRRWARWLKDTVYDNKWVAVANCTPAGWT